MAEIFVSYAREDEGRIQALVRALEAQGLSVFWDRRIPPGKSWREHIGQALADARCVIVAWSAHSIDSSFVAEEADDARSRDLLVPVLIDPVLPPLGLRSVQAAEMFDLGRGDPPAGFGSLLDAVRAALERPRSATATLPSPPTPTPTRSPVPAPAASIAAAGAVAGPPARKALAVAAIAGLVIVAALGWAWRQLAGGEASSAPPLARQVGPQPVVTPPGDSRGPNVQVLDALRLESGGLLVRVQLTLAGHAAQTVTGREAFSLLRRDGQAEAPDESRPIFDTLQPGAPMVFELRFRNADGVALRTALPDTPPLDTRLAAAR
jgi:hypothetical protein